jgi:hypothetical protein
MTSTNPHLFPFLRVKSRKEGLLRLSAGFPLLLAVVVTGIWSAAWEVRRHRNVYAYKELVGSTSMIACFTDL